MKIYHKLFLLFCLMGLVGCSFQDDASNCPKNFTGRTTIIFTLTDDSGTPTFDANLFGPNQTITSVNAFIFDSTKTLILEQRFEANNLLNYRISTKNNGSQPGWRVELDPGDYYVVCWGNVSQPSNSFRTFTRGITLFDDCAITVPSGATNGDPLYYAPYTLSPFQTKSAEVTTRAMDPQMALYHFKVVKGGDDEKVMPFICAHRTVKVYVIGYNKPESPAPVIQGTHLEVEYDFSYHVANQYKDFTQLSKQDVTPDGEACYLVTFYFDFDEITDEINFILKETAMGAPLATANLLQFIIDSHKTLKENLYEIIFRQDKFDLGFTIEIPDWSVTPIKPR